MQMYKTLQLSIVSALVSLIVFALTISLAHGDSLPNPNGFEIPPGLFDANFVKDIGDVAVIKFSGDYNRNSADGSINSAARAVVAREYYATHPDNYDFLVIFSDFEFETDGAAAFHLGVSNAIEGIGLPIFSNTELFGSDGELKGYIDMANIDRYVSSSLDVNRAATDGSFDSALKTLAHETLHQWAAHTQIEDFQGRDNGHWNFFLDTEGSIEYGHDWRDNGNGTFTAEAARNKFSSLDLYLMGLVSSEEVADMFVIEPETNEFSKSDLPSPGITVSGTRKDYTMHDFLSVHGTRSPTIEKSDKIFKYGFIYLTSGQESSEVVNIGKINNIQRAYEDRFAILTGGRGIAQVYPSTDLKPDSGTVNVIDSGSGPSQSGVDTQLAIKWLRDARTTGGYWEDKPATGARDTQVAMTVLAQYDSQFLVGEFVTDWLVMKAGDNTDSLSRAIRIFPENELLLHKLIDSQNTDGGWGLNSSLASSVNDTALALCALASSDLPNALDARYRGISFLSQHQAVDGGWSFVSSAHSSISATSLVLDAYRCSNQFNVETDRALVWLASKVNLDGGFGDQSSTTHETAQVMQAFLNYGATDKIEYELAAQYISEQQSTAGDWQGSVYTTALALEAIQSSSFPNFRVVSVGELDVQVADGEFVKLTAHIENDSSDSAPASVARFYLRDPRLGGVEIGAANVPALPPFSEISLMSYWNSFGQSGVQQIFVVADADEQVVERNEADNILSSTLTIEPPANGVELLVNKTEFTVNPQNLTTLPARLELSATIRNIGDTGADNVLLELWREQLSSDDASSRVLLGSQRVSLASRSSTGVVFTHSQSEPGRSVFTLVIDADDQFDEVNESNNEASTDVNTVDGIDLSVTTTDITISTSPIYVNQNVDFSVKIRNNGTVTTPSSELVFSVLNPDGEITLNTLNISLDPGEEKTFTQSWLADFEGQSTVKVDIDPQNLVAEIDEDNNTAEKIIDASLAEGNNLSVHFSELEINPSIGLEGMGASLTAIVRNTGTNDVAAATVSFYDGNPQEAGQLIAGTLVENLESAQSILAEVIWRKIPDDTTRFIYVVVDPEDNLDELNENDNVAFQKFSVLSLPDIAIAQESIQSQPRFPRVNEPIEFSVSVANRGKQEIESVSIAAYAGNDTSGHLISETQIDIAGSNSVDWTFDFAFDAVGEQSIFVIVDGEDTILESVESNNSALKKYFIQDGDFYVSDLYLSPDGNDIKDSVTYFFNLQEPSIVSVVVINKYGVEIFETEVSDEAVQNGAVTWDGRNAFGGAVADGKYDFAVKDEVGAYLGRKTVVVDTNRSPLSEAIDTPFGLNRNLTCRVGEIDKIYDNSYRANSPKDDLAPDTQNVVYGPNDQYIYFATYFPPITDAEGNIIRIDERTLFPSGVYRALNNGADVIQLFSNDDIPIPKIHSINVSGDGQKLVIQEYIDSTNSRLWALDNDGENLTSYDVVSNHSGGIYDIQQSESGQIFYRTAREIFRLPTVDGGVPQLILDTQTVYDNLGLSARDVISFQVNDGSSHATVKLRKRSDYRSIQVSYDLLSMPNDYILLLLDLNSGSYTELSQHATSHEWSSSRGTLAVASAKDARVNIYDRIGNLTRSVDLSRLQEQQFSEAENELITSYLLRFVGTDDLDGLRGRIEEIAWNPDESEFAFVFEDYLASVVISNGCSGGYGYGFAPGIPTNRNSTSPLEALSTLFISNANAGIFGGPTDGEDCKDLTAELEVLFSQYKTADGIYIAKLDDSSVDRVAITSTLEVSGSDFENEYGVVSPDKRVLTTQRVFGSNALGFPLAQGNLPFIGWTGSRWLNGQELESLRTMRWLTGARELLISNGDALTNYERYPDDQINNRYDLGQVAKEDLPFTNTVLLSLDHPTEETQEVFVNRDLVTYESFKTKRGVYPSNTGKFLSFFSQDEFDQCAANNLQDGYRQFQSLHNLTADLRVIKSPRVGGFLVEGSAVDKHFASYRLEYADVDSPTIWNLITPPSDTPVIDDRFTNWVPPYIGRFYVRLTVVDLAGNQRQEINQVSNAEKPSISAVFISQAYFSPNGDGTQDTTALKFRVLEPVNLEIQIFDEHEQLVRTFVESFDVVGSEESISWNGRSDDGQLLADGKYKVVVQRYEFFTTLDNTPPELSDFTQPLFVPKSLDRRRFNCDFPSGIASDSIFDLVDEYCRVTQNNMFRGTLLETNLDTFAIQSKPLSGAVWSDVADEGVLSVAEQGLLFITSAEPDEIRANEYRYIARDLAGNSSVLRASDKKQNKAHILSYTPLIAPQENGFGYAEFLPGRESNKYRMTWNDTPEQFQIKVAHSATTRIRFVELLYRDADLQSDFESLAIDAIPDSEQSQANGLPDFSFLFDRSKLSEVEADRYEVKIRLRLENGEQINSDAVVISTNWVWETQSVLIAAPDLVLREQPSLNRVQFATNVPSESIDRIVVFVKSTGPIEDNRYSKDDIYKIVTESISSNGGVQTLENKYSDIGRLVREDLSPEVFSLNEHQFYDLKGVRDELSLIEGCGYEYEITALLFHHNSVLALSDGIVGESGCVDLLVDVDPVEAAQCNTGTSSMLDIALVPVLMASENSKPLFIQVGIPKGTDELQSVLYANNLPDFVESSPLDIQKNIGKLTPAQRQNYTNRIDTSVFPEGSLPLRGILTLENGSTKVRDFIAPIVHTLPTLEVTYPQPEQKICAVEYENQKGEKVKGLEIQGVISSRGPSIRVALGGESQFGNSLNGGYQIGQSLSAPFIDRVDGSDNIISVDNIIGPSVKNFREGKAFESKTRLRDRSRVATSPILYSSVSDFTTASGILAVPVAGGSDIFNIDFEVSNWGGAKLCKTITTTIDAEIDELELELIGGVDIPTKKKPVMSISPNGDGRFDAVTVDYGVGESVVVSIMLYAGEFDEKGQFNTAQASIWTLPERQISEGNHQFDWDGTDDSGETVADGVYQIQVTFVDGCGNTETEKRLIGVDTTPPQLAITYPVTGDDVPLFIRILGLVEDTHPGNAQLSISNNGSDFTLLNQHTGNVDGELGQWDSFKQEGAWFFLLEAEDALANRASIDQAFIVPVRPNLISTLETTEYFVSPNSDGRLDTLTIRAGFDLDVLATVTIRNSEQLLVKQLTNQAPYVAGYSTLIWDGLNQVGDVAADGVYSVQVVAEGGGNIQTEAVQFELDNTPPEAELYQLSDGYIKLAGSDQILGVVSDRNFVDYEMSLQTVQGASNPIVDPLQISFSTSPVGQLIAQIPQELLSYEQEYETRLLVRDKAGNHTVLEPNMVVDFLPPRVNIAEPLDGAVFNANASPLLLSGLVEDAFLKSYTVNVAAKVTPESATLITEGDQSVYGLITSLDISALDDGAYIVTVDAQDLSGLKGQDKVEIIIDNTPPVINIARPTLLGYVTELVSVTGAANDENFEQYTLAVANGHVGAQGAYVDLIISSKPVTGGTLLNWSELLPDGEHTFELSAVDVAGNTSVLYHPFTVDTQPPAAPTLTLVEVGDTKDNIQVEWLANSEQDLAGYNLYQEGVKINDVLIEGLSFAHSDLLEGTYIYVVKAVDQAGLESEPSNSLSAIIDTTPPIAVIASPLDGARVNLIVDILGTAYSEDDFKQYRVLGGQSADSLSLIYDSNLPVRSGLLSEWDTLSLLDNAEYLIRLETEDIRGNVGRDEATVVVDNLATDAPINLSANIQDVDDVKVTWEFAGIADDLFGYLLYRNGGLVTSNEAVVGSLKPYAVFDTSFIDQDLPDGDYEYVVYAIDQAGNISAPSNTDSVTLDNRPPKAIITSVEDGQPFEDELLLLAETPDIDIAHVLLQYRAEGDSAWTDLVQDIDLPYEHHWLTHDLPYGDYEIRAVATDVGGSVDPDPNIKHVSKFDAFAPAVVLDLAVNVDRSTGLITWSENSEQDLAGYNVYRAPCSACSYSRINTGLLTQNNYQDFVQIEEVYYYKVSAIDNSDNESELSDFQLGVYIDTVLVATPPVSVDGRVAVDVGLQNRGLDFERTTILATAPNRTLDTIVVDGPESGPATLFQLDSMGVHRFVAFAESEEYRFISRNSVESTAIATGKPSIPTALAASIENSPIGDEVVLNWASNPDTDQVVGYKVFLDGEALLENQLITDAEAFSNSSGPIANFLPSSPPTSYWGVNGADIRFGQSWNDERLVRRIELDWAARLYSAEEYDIYAEIDGEMLRVTQRIVDSSTSQMVELSVPILTKRIEVRVVTWWSSYRGGRLNQMRIYADELSDDTSFYRETPDDGVHEYAIKAVNVFSGISDLSEPARVIFGDVEPPEAVVLAVSVDHSKALLTWDASADAIEFDVYQDGEYIATTSELSLTVTSLANGVYMYHVIAKDAAKNESAESNVVEAVINIPVLTAPIDLQAVANDELLNIGLTWLLFDLDAPETYKVYRSLTRNGDYNLIATTDVELYLDFDVSKGTRYFYVVTALDELGNESAHSNKDDARINENAQSAKPAINLPTDSSQIHETVLGHTNVGGLANPGSDVFLLHQSEVIQGPIRASDVAMVAELSLPINSRFRTALIESNKTPLAILSSVIDNRQILMSYTTRDGVSAWRDIDPQNIIDGSFSASKLIALGDDRVLIANNNYDATNHYIFSWETGDITQVSLNPPSGVFIREIYSYSEEHNVLIARASTPIGFGVFKFDLNTFQPTLLPNYYDFRTSPNGRYFAYISSTATFPTTVSVLDLVTDQTRSVELGDVSRNTVFGGQEIWSPDSERLVLKASINQVQKITIFDHVNDSAIVIDEDSVAPLPAQSSVFEAVDAIWQSRGVVVYTAIDRLTGTTYVREYILASGQSKSLDNLNAGQNSSARLLASLGAGSLIMARDRQLDSLLELQLPGRFIFENVSLVEGENQFSAVSIDGQLLITEPADEITVIYQSVAMPDYQLEVDIDPSIPIVDRDANIQIRVINAGQVNADAANLSITILDTNGDPRTFAQQVVGPFAEDSSVIIELPWTPTISGEYSFIVEVDNLDLVRESIESNNTRIITVQVAETATPALEVSIEASMNGSNTFTANERVAGAVKVVNPGESFTGNLVIEVVDSVGALVDTLSNTPVTDLAYAGELDVEYQWNTQTTIVGDYAVQARLFDTSFAPVVTGSESFEIADTLSMMLGLSSDQASYAVNSDAVLTATVVNRSISSVFIDGVLSLTIASVDGQMVYASDSSIGQILNNDRIALPFIWTVGYASPGLYTATASLLKDGEVIATSISNIEVLVSPVLNGRLSLSDDELALGQALEFASELKNQGNIGFNNIEVTYTVFTADTPVTTLAQSVSQLDTFDELSREFMVPANSLPAGRYRLVMTAIVPLIGQSPLDLVLDEASFVVVENIPPTVTIIQPEAEAIINGQRVQGLISAQDESQVESVSVKFGDLSWQFLESLPLDETTYFVSLRELAEGPHELYVRATDGNENVSNTKQRNFVIDNSPPLIHVMNVAQNQIFDTVVTPDIKVVDLHLERWSATLNGQPWLAGSQLREEGSFTLVINAFDRAGNASKLSLSFVIENLPPPITDLLVADDQLMLRRGVWGTVDVLANDQYEDLSGLTLEIIQQPTNGNLVIASKGKYNYFPALSFIGEDEFTYKVTDSVTAKSAAATVRVDVGPAASCSIVPDYSSTGQNAVDLPAWAITDGDDEQTPRYRISIKGVSDLEVFLPGQHPQLSFPSCDLRYHPKPKQNTKVVVTYQVTDVLTNGGRYTSPLREFTLTIDSRNMNSPVMVPIYLLLLDEDAQ